MNRSGFAAILVIGVIAAFIVIAGSVAYLLFKQPEKLVPQTHQTGPTGPSAASPASSAVSVTTTRFQNKISFLKGGEVWIADEGGTGLSQVTSTGGKVESYAFSPNALYLAYDKHIGIRVFEFDDGSGHKDLSVTDVSILDLATNTVIKTVTSKDLGPNFGNGDWVSFDRWYSDSQFGVMDIEPLSVVGPYNFSLLDVHPIPVQPPDGDLLKNYLLGFGISLTSDSRLYYSDFQLKQDNGSSLFYTRREFSSTTSGQSLEFRIMDSATKRDTLFGTIRNEATTSLNVAWSTMNHRNTEVAYMSWSNIILYPSLQMIYTIASSPSPQSNRYIRQIQWSFDDRFVGIALTSNEETPPNKLVIVEATNPSNTITVGGSFGYKFSWTRDGNVIFPKNNDLYLLNMKTASTTLFVAAASDPHSF